MLDAIRDFIELNIDFKKIGFAIIGVIIILTLLGWVWSWSPGTFSVRDKVDEAATQMQVQPVTGFATTTALIEVGDTMLNKAGGYLSNDISPPGVFMDNMPAWEFGVLEMVRDLTLAMRKDFSRSQSQSVENEFLVKAQPNLNIDSTKWILPSAESQYGEALDLLRQYRAALVSQEQTGSQFFARADNLRDYLKEVEKRLGSMSQKLSASVGSEVINTDLAGDASARQSTPVATQIVNKTSWFKIDDNFYQARGMSWALLHILKGIEIDFRDVLQNKNALVSLRQIIRELEATQETVYSPMILNGSGFGMLANHSLVMANYISRANAAIIELSELLNRG
jgi:hypothetical protein